jgi:hypothetical protein
VDATFDSNISGAEQTTLNDLIAAHINTPLEIGSSIIEQVILNSEVKQTSYKTVGKIIHLGSKVNGTIKKIEIIGYKDSRVTSFDVRFVDKHNGSNVICENTGLTNDAEEIIDMGAISNQPVGRAIFEVQAKRVGGSGSERIYIDTILIKY